jgi:hypothetical protein
LAKTNFEILQVYQLSERLADEIWNIVDTWEPFAKGSGRGSFQDNRRFVKIARGSLNETKHWLRRAYCRKLLAKEHVGSLKPLVDELAPRLNAYLKSIGNIPVSD